MSCADNEAHSFPLTQEIKDELDKRLAAEEAGEMTYSSWEDVKVRLLAEK